MQTEKWPKHTRLNRLSGEASAYRGSKRTPVTSLDANTQQQSDRPLQQGCSFITNTSVEKGQRAKRDSFCHHAATTSNKLAYYCQQARR